MPLSVSPGSSTAKASLSSDNAKDKSPAFQGAFRAFNTDAVSSANAFNGANGALAAASFAGSGGRGQIRTYSTDGLSPLSMQSTGQSLRSRDPSPSHVAANIAASQAFRRPSRAHEPSFAHQQNWGRSPSLRRMPTGPSSMEAQSEDIPAPATKSLVQLYESKQNPPPAKVQSIRYVSKPGPPIRSPKPVRPLARSVTSASILSSKVQAPLRRTSPKALRNELNVSPHDATVSTTKQAGSASGPLVSTQEAQAAKHEPLVAQSHGKEQQIRGNGNSKVELKPVQARRSTALPALVQRDSQEIPRDIPREARAMSSVFPPPNRSSSSDSKGSSPLPARPPSFSAKSYDKTSPQPIPRQTSREHTLQLSNHMSVDSLANAMVASSLASSRAPSPTKSVPLPPPPRRHHFFHRHSSQEAMSRTPSPAKTMRHTMRRPPESDEETDGYRRGGKKHLVRKHQHKHHEGDRKRYRTQVTERERKRYEGVWAANRGLLIPLNDVGASTTTTTTTSSSTTRPTATTTTTTTRDAVLNLVVKDLWRRSRLPNDVLEEVWELVTGSQGEVDRLGREEFVVGLWLIDQRLKGNKLPVKVSESVWASVRRLPGIKVPRSRY